MSVTNTTIIGISCIPFAQKVKFLRFHNLILDETTTTVVVNFKNHSTHNDFSSTKWEFLTISSKWKLQISMITNRRTESIVLMVSILVYIVDICKQF